MKDNKHPPSNWLQIDSTNASAYYVCTPCMYVSAVKPLIVNSESLIVLYQWTESEPKQDDKFPPISQAPLKETQTSLSPSLPLGDDEQLSNILNSLKAMDETATTKLPSCQVEDDTGADHDITTG